MIKRLLTALLMFSMAWPVITHAGINDAEAINKAGRQRMLSQRIARSYMMLGAQINTLEAQKQLDESIGQFEQQYLELQDYAARDNSLNVELKQLESAWIVYRSEVLGHPDKDQAAQILQQSDAVLAAADSLVHKIQDKSGLKSAKLINISGRQRMLSQRIGKLYLAMYWHISTPGLSQEFNKAMQEYESALDVLMHAPENTDNIRTQLHKVKAQWDFSKAGFKQYQEGRFVPMVIATTTDTMLRQMELVTAAYEGAVHAAQSSQQKKI